ncbi:hypothetical protein D3C80_770370 [compost metagenome]
MAGIEAEAGQICGNVLNDLLQLIGKFDVAAGMGMDGGAHAVFFTGERCDGADVFHHAVPGVSIEARRAVGMAGGIVPLVMSPVHHRQIGGGKTLAGMGFGFWQAGDQRTDLVGLAQQVAAVFR